MTTLIEVDSGDVNDDDYPPDEIECSSGPTCLGAWDDHQGNLRAASIGWVFTSHEDNYGREIEGLRWNTIWTDPNDPTVQLCEDCADRHEHPDQYDENGWIGPVVDAAVAAVAEFAANVEIITVRIGGTPDTVQQLLDGLPGDHRAEHLDGERYSIATTNAGFLRFAITSQGYGEVLDP